MLFRLSSPVLVLVVSIVIIGSTVLGFLLGRVLVRRGEGLREPLGVTQGALVGFVALLLAFGLTMAVGRYESRRAAVVTEANVIGTTYLRAQTLTEPERSKSLALIKQYTDLRIRLDHEVPGSKRFDETSDTSQQIQNQLWALAGDALNASPVDSAPRLYVETLNDMIDAHTTRGARRSTIGSRPPCGCCRSRRPQWRLAYSPRMWRCSAAECSRCSSPPR